MSSAIFLAALLVASAGDPPKVHYVTKAETRSWEPIAIAEVEKAVETAALAGLSRDAQMRLVRVGFAELEKGEYRLLVQGRFIEEAERFAVYLTFGPGERKDLGSFFVTETSEPLGRQPRATMEQRIRQAAERAGQRLGALLGPQLERVRLRVEAPPLEAEPLPLDWGPVEVPDVGKKSKAMQVLLDVRNPDHQRFEALRELQGHVFDQQPARNVVERCVLRDPTPKLRASCVRALEPVARAHAPTQRVLLGAMRSDVDDEVLTTLADISANFVGLSRGETIATWLELVAADGTPTRAAEHMAKLLGAEGDVPNLDLAVARCLQQESMTFGKRYACAQHLLKSIPKERRRAVVWRYLERTAVWDTGERLTFEAVLDRTFERKRKEEVDPALVPLLLQIAERTSAGSMRGHALYLARDVVPPTPETFQRLIRLAHEQRMADSALRAISDIVRRAPDQAAMVAGALERLRAEVKWYPKPSRSDPYKELDDVLKRVERLVEKGGG